MTPKFPVHEIEYSHDRTDSGLNVSARWRGILVGYARGYRKGTGLYLADLQVEREWCRTRPWWQWPLVKLGIASVRMQVQGLGIGSRMLQMTIDRARELNVEEIWGCVTFADASATPSLLDWYRRRGFDVLPVDDKCSKELLAVARIRYVVSLPGKV